MLECCSADSVGRGDAGKSLSGNSGSGRRIGALREELTAALRAGHLALPGSSSQRTVPIARSRSRWQEPCCETPLPCARSRFVAWMFCPLVPQCFLIPVRMALVNLTPETIGLISSRTVAKTRPGTTMSNSSAPWAPKEAPAIFRTERWPRRLRRDAPSHQTSLTRRSPSLPRE